MIFQEISTTFLPCNEKLKLPLQIRNLNVSSTIKRKESNGGITYVDQKTKKVYFQKKDFNIFPLDVPVQVDLELTQRCNLHCRHCFVTNQSLRYSNETFKIIKKLVASKVAIFELIGGEPFLAKDIFKIIKYLKKCRKIVSISTNGTLITRKVAKKLSKNKVRKIFVSLDGPRKINDLIRGNGSFDKAFKGIRNLNEQGICPTISFCINKVNINFIRQMVKELQELKIKSIFFIFGEPPNKNNSFTKYFFKHSERERIARKILTLDLPVKCTIHFEPRKINALYYGCFFRLTMCEVTPNGDVLSCPIIRKCEGNILKEDLKTIWKRMQSNLIINRPKKCNSCRWNRRCFPCKFDFESCTRKV
jgi:MoaA/NifB/PqqE/SkfB family radical SAM enzyme